MSPLAYKVLHLLGLMFAFLSFGGLIAAARSGDVESRRVAGITHGISLLVLLLSGFALLGKLGLGFPGWAIAKVAIWVALGGIIVLIRKQPKQANLWWMLVPLLGLAAAYLAVFKPF